jgi:hypothetical protein
MPRIDGSTIAIYRLDEAAGLQTQGSQGHNGIERVLQGGFCLLAQGSSTVDKHSSVNARAERPVCYDWESQPMHAYRNEDCYK